MRIDCLFIVEAQQTPMNTGKISVTPQLLASLCEKSKLPPQKSLLQQLSSFLHTILSLLIIILLLTLCTVPRIFATTSQSNNGTQKRTDKPTQESVNEDGATSTSRLALPFKRLWQYAEETTTFAPAVDEKRIYLPLAGGRVVCLDRQDGSRLWMSELGGNVSAPVVIGEQAVFVATRKVTADGAEAGAALRAIDKTTGLTLWAHDYPRYFPSPLVLDKMRLYAGCADGALYAISITDGEVVWKAQTADVVRAPALVTETVIYFGSDDGAMRGVEHDKGREVFKFQTPGKIAGAPVMDERFCYFGSSEGFVYAVDKVFGKLRWRSRTGASVEATPVITGDKILVASFDNFIYALSRSSGNRLWKRRFDNRLIAAPLVEGDAAMIAPYRGDAIAVFLSADGRRVNFYRLEKETEIVAAPVLSDNLLLIPTDKGLLAATPAQATDTRTNAVKKP